MKRFLLSLSVLSASLISINADEAAASPAEAALSDIKRAIDLADATWDTNIKGEETSRYMADMFNTSTETAEGTSDVWPLTAAIEAHCGVLEALEAIKDIDPALYDDNHDLYIDRLNQLITGLDFYRGSYTLSSYATSSKPSQPYGVHRGWLPGTANVKGIENVYDDQMWICRELIRAYRLTDNKAYLDRATYLADYVLDGWDCWRDEAGKEYGGITWGPGYNSKHACSNAPVIQPLVWLSQIYADSGETIDFYSRNEENSVRKSTVDRSAHYLEYAAKVYDWQRENLLHTSGCYWDMKGADGTIKVVRGYRQHVDCGGPVGNLYSYNTGTMISGAVELYKATGNDLYIDHLNTTIAGSIKQFTRNKRTLKAQYFLTDATAESGFNTWFNNVLFRSYVDAYDVMPAKVNTFLEGFQVALDYGFDNHLRCGMLPINLLDGWGTDVKTKGFHQFAFVSQYAMMAKKHMMDAKPDAIEDIEADDATEADGKVYNLSGVCLGDFSSVASTLPAGLYIVNHKLIKLSL